jgi:hypothetical protein
MEILDLLEEKYNDKEYNEIKKLINIQKQNLEMLNNFKSIHTLNNQLLDSLKTQLHSNNKEMDALSDLFYENYRLMRHILACSESLNNT